MVNYKILEYINDFPNENSFLYYTLLISPENILLFLLIEPYISKSIKYILSINL
jgi:hypothetical protein